MVGPWRAVARTLRPRWARWLNDSNLIDTLLRAHAFREVADARVPEHALFYAYGIWQVNRVSGANMVQEQAAGVEE